MGVAREAAIVCFDCCCRSVCKNKCAAAPSLHLPFSLYTILDSEVGRGANQVFRERERERECVRLIVKCLLNYSTRGKFKQLCPWPAHLFGILWYSRSSSSSIVESWNHRVEWDSPLCVLLQHTTHNSTLCGRRVVYIILFTNVHNSKQFGHLITLTLN